MHLPHRSINWLSLHFLKSPWLFSTHSFLLCHFSIVSFRFVSLLILLLFDTSIFSRQASYAADFYFLQTKAISGTLFGAPIFSTSSYSILLSNGPSTEPCGTPRFIALNSFLSIIIFFWSGIFLRFVLGILAFFFFYIRLLPPVHSWPRVDTLVVL